MKLASILIAASAAFVVLIFVFAAVRADVSLRPQTLQIGTPGPGTPSTANEEVQILRAQLEQMRAYDEKLLQTVYWALGSAVAVVATAGGLLVGFGWFANMRQYDRDKAALQQEIQSKMDAERTAAASAAATMRQEVADSARKAMDTRFGEMMEELRRTELSLLQLQAQQWEERNAPMSALRIYIQICQVLLELQWSSALGQALIAIQGTLSRGVPPEPDLLRDLATMLDRLPDEHRFHVEAIRGTIQGKLSSQH